MTRRHQNWQLNKEQSLLRLMREIQKRRGGDTPESIHKITASIERRLKRRPVTLGRNRLYSPSSSTLIRHYYAWIKGPQNSRLRPRYKAGQKKAQDDFVPYFLSILLHSKSTKEAFQEVTDEWKAGFLIPGIGKKADSLLTTESGEFPMCLSSLLQHRFTQEERNEIHRIIQGNAKLHRAAEKIAEAVQQRLANQ